MMKNAIGQLLLAGSAIYSAAYRAITYYFVAAFKIQYTTKKYRMRLIA